MIAVLSDTHRREGHGLVGAARAAVRDADVVVHAGDFTVAPVLDALRAESARLAAVVGNNDDAEIRDRLPAQRVVEAEGCRLVVVHGHEHSATALALLGRQEGADVVVHGHSHRPGVADAGDVLLLNPGSHAQPRGFRPAFATLRADGEAVAGALREPDGTHIESFEVGPR